MGRFEFDIPDDLFKELEGSFDDVAPKMIDAALPVYQKAMEQSIKQSVSSAPEAVKRQTSGLVKSLTVRKAKQSDTNAYIGNIVFAGKDSKGSPNVVKAMGLEYGNSHQIPSPFMQRAVNSCEKNVLAKMEEVFNREVKQ